MKRLAPCHDMAAGEQLIYSGIKERRLRRLREDRLGSIALGDVLTRVHGKPVALVMPCILFGTITRSVTESRRPR